MRWLWDDEAWVDLRRDFVIEELVATLDQSAVDEVLLVQAAPELTETEMLLAVAATTPEVVGVVGWVPLSDPVATGAALDGLGRGLVGVRHVVGHGAERDLFRGDGDPRPALQLLAEAGLTFELMPAQVEDVGHLVRATEAVPELDVVLDHLAKPIGGPPRAVWRSELARLAATERAYSKISGWTTPVRTGWSADDLRPFVDDALSLFGPRRLIYGSNWPVSLVSGSYARVKDETVLALESCSRDERVGIMRRSARAAYKLGDPGAA
jgi:L-fuconolactonase